MSEAGEQAAQAVAAAAEAQADQAAAETTAAQAQANESVAAAAANTVAAAEAATALANAEAARTAAAASETIQRNEGDLQWLKQHAERMDSFSQSQAGEIQNLRQSQEALTGALAGIASALERLTPPSSGQEAGAVNPAESAKPEGQKAAGQNQNPPETPKRKRRLI